MKIGYTYAGKVGPSVDQQRAALLVEGVAPERIYHDEFTPARTPRRWLPEMIQALRPGDVAVFYSLDTLGPNEREAEKVLQRIALKGVGLVVVDGDLRAPAAADAVAAFSLLRAKEVARPRWNSAQWEPGLRAAARKRAPGAGRKPVLRGTKKTAARALWFDLSIEQDRITEQFDVDRTTLWRAFGPRDLQPGESLADFRLRQEGKKQWKPKRRAGALAST